MSPQPTQTQTEQDAAGGGVFEDKSEAFQVEIAQTDLNRVDLDKLSREALTFKSRATLRLAVVIAIQGLSKSPCSDTTHSQELSMTDKRRFNVA